MKNRFLVIILSTAALIVTVLAAVILPCWAKEIIPITVVGSDGNSSMLVNGTATVYTKSFSLNDGVTFGASYWANGTAGVTNVTISLEESYAEPTTEGSSQDIDYSVPLIAGTSMGNIVTNYTTNGTWQHNTFTPAPMKYGRFKIVGGGGNNITTVVKMKLYKQIES